jgi:HSP20 family protein
METNSPNGGRQAENIRNRPEQASQPGDMGTQRAGEQGQQSLRTGRESQDRARAMSPRRGEQTGSPGAYHPLSTMFRLSREMDQLMDSFFGNRFGAPRLLRSWPFSLGSEGGGNDLASTWTPSIDIRRREDAIVIHAELPGVAKDAVKIEATADGIAISGERSESRDEGGPDRGYQLQERTYGSFYRSIPLPEGAQVEEAKATMRDGVLEVIVPDRQDTNRRRIQIE